MRKTIYCRCHKKFISDHAAFPERLLKLDTERRGYVRLCFVRYFQSTKFPYSTQCCSCNKTLYFISQPTLYLIHSVLSHSLHCILYTVYYLIAYIVSYKQCFISQPTLYLIKMYYLIAYIVSYKNCIISQLTLYLIKNLIEAHNFCYIKRTTIAIIVYVTTECIIRWSGIT